MATLYVTEWRGIREQGGGIQAPYGFLKTQTVTIGAEAKTAVFQPDCKLIELSCDAICSFQIGASPTATTSDQRIPADTHGKFISVNGGTDKLSAVSNT